MAICRLTLGITQCFQIFAKSSFLLDQFLEPFDQ